MTYKDKDLNQWTPDDVAQAIADGYYTNGRARARALLENMKPQPETPKYLRNRLRRLDAVLHNLAAIAEHRGVHPFDVARQYLPERDRVRALLRANDASALRSTAARGTSMKAKRTKLSGKKLSREDLDKLIAAADRARERVSKRNAISRSDAVSGSAAVCPCCKGEGMTFGYGGANNTRPATCHVCDGAGKLWCAMCGKWGNRRNGGCPELNLETHSTTYLLNRHKRLCKVMNSAYSIAKHRGVTAAAIWNQYGPETLAIERVLAVRLKALKFI